MKKILSKRKKDGIMIKFYNIYKTLIGENIIKYGFDRKGHEIYLLLENSNNLETVFKLMRKKFPGYELTIAQSKKSNQVTIKGGLK
jgi:hypothetical protein